MRGVAWPVLGLILCLCGPAAAQSANELPHASLFGAWTGGLFPPPTTLSGRECLANPTVIFTRDVVMRAVVTDVAYTQRLIETVRDAGRGSLEFRLIPSQVPAMSSGGMFNLSPNIGAGDTGFGCSDPNLLRVQKRGENEIAFPNCAEFPYPLIRCQGQ
jgi:hypothetical protein